MFWIKLALSLALLALLGWMLDWSAIGLQLGQANPWYVAGACLLLLAGQVLSAVRWAWIARGLGLQVRTQRKIQLYFLGMFLSLFLPSIIGGDIVRGYLLARHRRDAGWPAAASVVLERLNGVFGLLLIVSITICLVEVDATWRLTWLVMAGLAWFGMLLHPWWWPMFCRFPVPERLSGWKRLPLEGTAFHRAWLLALPASVIFQLMVVQAHVWLGQAAGLDLSWSAYAVLVCLVALASALPLSLNGLGVREAGYVGLAVYFGGQPEAAASMAILWLFVLIVVALPGGIVLWRLGGLSGLRHPSHE
ncbi:MAG: UPF0104 family protein [Zetaproteobacteria bacterium]|nr:MAG: UPF0104 family protein [Zetaproteobacteria bacterium]